MKKMLLIINPKSGIKKSTQIFENVKDIMSENEWELETVYTEYRGHATELATAAVGYDRIVCMGGDGTFNEVANGIMLNPVGFELGYIPAGSTNDFAHGLGLSKKITKNAKFAANQSAFPTDMGLFCANGEKTRHFSYVASFGLFTDISYSTDQKIKNIFGHLAYVFEGIRSIADLNRFRHFKMRIEFGGEAFESEFIFGAVTNSTSLGGLVKLDRKKVHVGDGKFEILLIRKPHTLAELTETLTELVNNRFRTGNIIFGHVDNIRLISQEPLKWTFDGEYAGEVRIADISVLHGALNLVRPTTVRRKPFFKKKAL
ncbi:MAG: diacylglycerol kinase family lipid kinase [Clostridia bacterium]|nr:diacylglycerol kinase family lipid kinase [Clostridia bacterium]